MPECHTCDRNGKSDPACLKCRGPAETNHRGKTFLSIDAGSDSQSQTLGEVEAAAAGPDGWRAPFEAAECFEVDQDASIDPQQGGAGQEEGVCDAPQGCEPEPESPLEMARRLAYTFTELSTEEFDVVRRLMRGETMADIGREYGLTRAAISARVRELARKHPAFRFLRVGSPKR
jgi:hypothetical protein